MLGPGRPLFRLTPILVREGSTPHQSRKLVQCTGMTDTGDSVEAYTLVIHRAFCTFMWCTGRTAAAPVVMVGGVAVVTN